MAMTVRRLTTAVTMLTLVVIVLGAAVYGFNAVTAPLPESGPGDACTEVEKNVKTVVRRSEVQVSVFNGSGRTGLASATLESLVENGFRAGNAGNAPEDSEVRKVAVWTTEQDDPDARLVALAFGKGTRITVTEDDLGPGVDVILGPRYRRLDPKAPRTLKLPAPVETCIDVD